MRCVSQFLSYANDTKKKGKIPFSEKLNDVEKKWGPFIRFCGLKAA